MLLQLVQSARLHLQRITDFLSDRKQPGKLVKHISDSQTISTGSPQCIVLFPSLFNLYTHSCTSSHQSIKLLKFVDDTTFISGGDEWAYKWEIDHLLTWCGQNLELNDGKPTRPHHPYVRYLVVLTIPYFIALPFNSS